MRLAAVVCLLLAFGVGCGGAEEQSSPQQTSAAEPSIAAPERRPAPAISGESLSGETIALGDFRGRPLLINVWSSW
jgi:hypothetical protein